MTLVEICKKYNVKYQTGYKALKLNKIKGDLANINESSFKIFSEDIGRVPKILVKEWYSLFSNGMSITNIAKEFNKSSTTISKYLKLDFNADTRQYHKKRNPELNKLLNKMMQHYLETGDSLENTMRIFNYEKTKKESFINYIKTQGYKIKSLSDTFSYCVSSDFFFSIDSEIKAYLLGFFAADGHIEKEGALKISVHKEDSHILFLYNNVLCSGNANIRVKENMVLFSVKHENLRRDLFTLGFDNRKTYTWNIKKTLRQIPRVLYPHFIRGFFDGDGSAIINVRQANNRLAGYNRKASFSCYSKDTLETIQKIMEIKGTISCREHSNFYIKDHLVKNAFGCSLDIFNTSELIKLYKYLYKDANYFFKRKKDKLYLTTLNSTQIKEALQGNLH